jgi:hypothetical protein
VIKKIPPFVALTFVAFLLGTAISHADGPARPTLNPDYIRTDFTVEDGLPDNVINATVETENVFFGWERRPVLPHLTDAISIRSGCVYLARPLRERLTLCWSLRMETYGWALTRD